jgi:predicted regulator of Ras-like GTPase activity (Roadblock/LC7/MglB family)
VEKGLRGEEMEERGDGLWRKGYMAPPKNLINLSAYMAELKDSEGMFVLSADGQILASENSVPGQNIDWVEEFLDLTGAMSSILEEANVSGLESSLLQGPKRKMVSRRNSRLGFFVIVIGREMMDVGLAGMTAKNISLELESALGSTT